MVMLILPIFVILVLAASLPIWHHKKNWSFYSIGGVSLIILVVLFLVWTGRI
ncbi:MAG: DUF3309 family protein [Candidatus Acidiferrales bacterium]